MTRRRWITLAAISAATAMLLLDVTVVYVALPAISADLGASFADMQWVIDAYTVALAAVLLGAGALADRFGRRRVFVIGLLAFSVMSALCGTATSAAMLNMGRAVQGIGAAAMFAASLSILAHEFPDEERSFALGVWGAITGAALAIGPLVGGLAVDELGWRWIFLVNVPIGLALVGLTVRAIPGSRSRAARPVDAAGMATFGVASLLAVVGLIRGNEDGWSSPTVVASLGGAALATVVFVRVEARARAPVIPLALFRRPAFTGTALVAFGQSVAIYPLLLFLAIYLQDGLGLSATQTGLRLLPMTLAIFAVAPLCGRLTGSVSLRVPLATGLVLLAAALLLMRGAVPSESWTTLLPGLLLGGVGVGLISPALAAAMVQVLPVEQSGLASGINNTSRQLGIALGIAALGALFRHDEATATTQAVGIADGLNAVLLAAAAAAAASAAAAWTLLRHPIRS